MVYLKWFKYVLSLFSKKKKTTISKVVENKYLKNKKRCMWLLPLKTNSSIQI